MTYTNPFGFTNCGPTGCFPTSNFGFNTFPTNYGFNNVAPIGFGVNSCGPIGCGFNGPTGYGINNVAPIGYGVNNCGPTGYGFNNVAPIGYGNTWTPGSFPGFTNQGNTWNAPTWNSGQFCGQPSWNGAQFSQPIGFGIPNSNWNTTGIWNTTGNRNFTGGFPIGNFPTSGYGCDTIPSFNPFWNNNQFSNVGGWNTPWNCTPNYGFNGCGPTWQNTTGFGTTGFGNTGFTGFGGFGGMSNGFTPNTIPGFIPGFNSGFNPTFNTGLQNSFNGFGGIPQTNTWGTSIPFGGISGGFTGFPINSFGTGGFNTTPWSNFVNPVQGQVPFTGIPTTGSTNTWPTNYGLNGTTSTPFFGQGFSNSQFPVNGTFQNYPYNNGNYGPSFGSGFGQHFGHTVPFSDRVGSTLSNGTIGLNREAA